MCVCVCVCVCVFMCVYERERERERVNSLGHGKTLLPERVQESDAKKYNYKVRNSRKNITYNIYKITTNRKKLKKK